MLRWLLLLMVLLQAEFLLYEVVVEGKSVVGFFVKAEKSRGIAWREKKREEKTLIKEVRKVNYFFITRPSRRRRFSLNKKSIITFKSDSTHLGNCNRNYFPARRTC